jgi:hypothetical protein
LLSGWERVFLALGAVFRVRERLAFLSGLGKGRLVVAFRVRERLVLLSGLGRELFALRVRERLGCFYSGLGRDLVAFIPG